VTDEQATGTPQQNLPQEENRPDDQQASASGGGDSPEGKAEQDREGDTGATVGGDAERESGEGGGDGDDEVSKARKAAEEEEKAKEKLKELEEDPPEKLEDWPDDKAKYETFGGAEGDESYEESVTSKLGPSSLRFKEDGGVEIEGEEVDDPDEYKSDPIPGGPTDPRVSDSRAYGEPDLTDETSLDVQEEDGEAKSDASDDSGDDGDGDSSDDDRDSSGDAEKSAESS
jgi:hypothetical protein